MPEGIEYKVDVLNTWDMNVSEMEGCYSGSFTISWPSGQYMAVRMIKSN